MLGGRMVWVGISRGRFVGGRNVKAPCMPMSMLYVWTQTNGSEYLKQIEANILKRIKANWSEYFTFVLKQIFWSDLKETEANILIWIFTNQSEYSPNKTSIRFIANNWKKRIWDTLGETSSRVTSAEPARNRNFPFCRLIYLYTYSHTWECASCVCLPIVFLYDFICLPLILAVCLSVLYIFLSLYLSLHQSVLLSVCASVSMYVRRFVCLSVCICSCLCAFTAPCLYSYVHLYRYVFLRSYVHFQQLRSSALKYQNCSSGTIKLRIQNGGIAFADHVIWRRKKSRKC